MRQLVGDIPQGGSPYPPVASYGFLSDGEVAALVAPGGNVEWMCLPRFDGPSIFATILDRDAGEFRVAPVGATVPAGRRYIPGTMVLETSWATRTGWLVVKDVLLIGPWHHDGERSRSHRRSPTDTEASHVLLRTMRCMNGSVDVHVDCEPKPDYALAAVSWEYDGPAYASAVARVPGQDLVLRLTSDLRLGFEGGRARARTTLRAGQTAFVALGWSEHAGPETYDEAHDRLAFTADYWHEWLSHGQLPETPGGLRNWDYRYSWVRDSTFALWGLYSLGFDEEANDFFYFMRDVVGSDDDLQVLYGVGGEREIPERTLDHLEGYEGARPVRVGNAAAHQRQHDVWGALVDSIYLHTQSRDGLAESTWRILVRQVEDAIRHWREPDRGIWEVRGEPRHFTSSKVMCWVACDRGARLARLRGAHDLAERWGREADAIKLDVLTHAVDERGVFTQHYETTSLDASCLLIPLVRFLPSGDERVAATIDAIADELTVDGLVLRYLPEVTDDGLVGDEGAFVICTFWLVSALAEIGEHRRARGLCEKLLSYASPLDLYAEEIDPRTCRHLGNFPQAFSHLALINAVLHVIRADQDLARPEPLVEQVRREELPSARGS